MIEFESTYIMILLFFSLTRYPTLGHFMNINKQKRSICATCKYPTRTCLCESIEPILSDLTITILQDPIETHHAKNTARLVQLLLQQTNIHIGTHPSDFKNATVEIETARKPLLIYPSDSARNIHEINKDDGFDHIILIDATWRKAKKMWLNNPWLHSLAACKITPRSPSNYRIRVAPSLHALSTLEALSHVLQKVEDCNVEPADKALSALQRYWERHSKQ